MRLTHSLRLPVALTIAALVTALPAAAQPPAEPPAPPEPNWWEQSSLDAGPQNEWLTHVEGTFSFMHASGNTDGYSIDMRSSFDARYRRLTNRFAFDTSRQDVTYGLGGGEVVAHGHTIRNHVEYDLTRRALLAVGVEEFQDTLRFLDRRTTLFGGGGITISETPRQKLSVIGGVGRVYFRFDGDAMMNINPEGVAQLPTTSPTSGAFMVMQSWRIALPHRVTLTQEANVTDYFQSILGEQFGFSLSANVPFGRHVSFVPAFRLREEGNIYSQTLGMLELDHSITFGIRVSY